MQIVCSKCDTPYSSLSKCDWENTATVTQLCTLTVPTADSSEKSDETASLSHSVSINTCMFHIKKPSST